jgi:hypothetical protein
VYSNESSLTQRRSGVTKRCDVAPPRENKIVYLCNDGSSSAGIICNDGFVELVAAPNEKSAFALPFAGTVTCIVFSSPFAPPSLHATTVYVPGGTPLISNAPVSLLTEKSGCFNTPM